MKKCKSNKIELMTLKYPIALYEVTTYGIQISRYNGFWNVPTCFINIHHPAHIIANQKISSPLFDRARYFYYFCFYVNPNTLYTPGTPQNKPQYPPL